MRLSESQLYLSRRSHDVEPMHIARYHDPDDWIEMRINPQRISIQSRKVINRIQTNTRWVFQHWGMEPVTLQYSGVTGYIKTMTNATDTNPRFLLADEYDVTRKYTDPALRDYVSPYETPAYQALMVLRTFYEEPHKWLQGRDLTALRGAEVDEQLNKLLLRLHFRDGEYIGYFTRMTIQEDENSPWMWSYDMEFVAQYWNSRTKLTQRSMSELVWALFATTSSFNMSSDDQLAAAWDKGVAATVGASVNREFRKLLGW